MRKIVFSAATAAIVAFATAGWAQVLNQDSTSCSSGPSNGEFCLSGQYTTPPSASASRETLVLATYAKELFGEGSRDVVLTLANNTDFRLTADFSSYAIPIGKVANITFTLLNGVQFAESVSAIAFTEGGSVPSPVHISQADSTGGERGDSSVTYVVKAEQILDQANSVFTFTLPKLMNAGGVLGGETVDDREPTVKMSVTVEPGGGRFQTGNDFKAFPPSSSTGSSDNTRSLANSTLRYPLTVAPTEEQSVNINIDDRTAFVVPNGNVQTVSGSDFGSTGRSALKVATLDIDTAAANGADNRAAFQASSGDMLNITVTGPIGTGDILFLSRDTTYSTSGANRDVVLTVTGRTATSTVTLTSVADGHERTVYLVPAADRTLSRGLYRTTFEADFSEDSMRDTTARTEVVRLEYSNLTVQGYAYAMPNPGVSDVGNLRLRCESSGNCAVFLDCYDQNGRSIGGFPEMTVMARATRVLNTKSTVDGTSLARLLGVETWDGRLSCEILSNANVGVQVLTRSGGTLVNNTYISGSEPSTTP